VNPAIMSVALLLGYLLGAVSFARLVGRFAMPGEDLSKTTFAVAGVENPVEMTSVSATTVMMRKGAKYGCLTSILDILKVMLPTLFFRWQYPEEYYFLLTAVAGVAGHNFPIYYRFKGGRGVSPIFGGLLVIDWIAIPVTVLTSNLLGLVLFRDVFIAYSGFTVLLIPWMWLRYHDWAYVGYATAVTLLFFLAMIPESRQYYRAWRSGELANIDVQEIMAATHMKYVIRLGQRLGLLKPKPETDIGEPAA